MSKPTQLYRHFDSEGRLLYVGISLSAITRLSQHNDCSHWANSIRSVSIESFETREEAVAAERAAINAENPAHNLWRPKVVKNDRIEESRNDLLKRVVQFNPVYSKNEAAIAIGINPTQLNRLIENGKLGHIVLSEREQNTRAGRRVIKKIAITGWQLLDYIESLQNEAEHAA